jgi:hypothetical protein
MRALWWRAAVVALGFVVLSSCGAPAQQSVEPTSGTSAGPSVEVPAPSPTLSRSPSPALSDPGTPTPTPTPDDTTGESRRVGDDQVGYLTLPGNWVAYQSAILDQGGAQYSDGLAVITVVVHQGADAAAMSTILMVPMAQDCGADPTTDLVHVDGIDTYKASCAIASDRMTVLWVLQTAEQTLHIITLDGPVSSAVEGTAIVESTFALEP